MGRSLGLIGALVGGKEVGDTALIRTLLSSSDDPEQPSLPDPLSLVSFPNPFRSSTTLSLLAKESGQYTLSIYNVIGQEVFREEVWLQAHQEWRGVWGADRALPAGMYAVRAVSERDIAATWRVVKVN